MYSISTDLTVITGKTYCTYIRGSKGKGGATFSQLWLARGKVCCVLWTGEARGDEVEPRLAPHLCRFGVLGTASRAHS